MVLFLVVLIIVVVFSFHGLFISVFITITLVVASEMRERFLMFYFSIHYQNNSRLVVMVAALAGAMAILTVAIFQNDFFRGAGCWPAGSRAWSIFSGGWLAVGQLAAGQPPWHPVYVGVYLILDLFLPKVATLYKMRPVFGSQFSGSWPLPTALLAHLFCR